MFCSDRCDRKAAVSIHNCRKSLTVQKFIVTVFQCLPVSMSVDVNKSRRHIAALRIQDPLRRKIRRKLRRLCDFFDPASFYYDIALKRSLVFSIYDLSITDDIICHFAHLCRHYNRNHVFLQLDIAKTFYLPKTFLYCYKKAEKSDTRPLPLRNRLYRSVCDRVFYCEYHIPRESAHALRAFLSALPKRLPSFQLADGAALFVHPVKVCIGVRYCRLDFKKICSRNFCQGFCHLCCYSAC